MAEAGRPTKYDPSFCELIVEHCKTGASLASFAAEINVARSTINHWGSQHEEFADAIERAKVQCAAWWERVARKNADLGGGNAALCIFGLKNMAPEDWRDKQEYEHTGKDGGPIEIENRSEAVTALAAALRSAKAATE